MVGNPHLLWAGWSVFLSLYKRPCHRGLASTVFEVRGLGLGPDTALTGSEVTAFLQITLTPAVLRSCRREGLMLSLGTNGHLSCFLSESQCLHS